MSFTYFKMSSEDGFTFDNLDRDFPQREFSRKSSYNLSHLMEFDYNGFFDPSNIPSR